MHSDCLVIVSIFKGPVNRIIVLTVRDMPGKLLVMIVPCNLCSLQFYFPSQKLKAQNGNF